MSHVCSVLFVCLGNICRSPTAHGVFQAKVAQQGLSAHIVVDSAGTADWHTGKAPDPRAIAEASTRGYDLSELKARQAMTADFDRFDYVIAMDESNLQGLQQLCPEEYSGHLGLMLEFAPQQNLVEVPDPYYGGDEGFAEVLDLLEQACDGLLARACKDFDLAYDSSR
ncbi:MAG: low molecular weight protein-tyrosine-phosphatase [Halioglobus sp.]